MNEPLTLSMVAGFGRKHTGIPLSGRERAEARSSIETALADASDVSKWPGVAGLVLDTLAGQLAVPVANLLSEGWKQDAAMRKALQGGKAGPAAAGEVVLHTHTITSTLTPKAEVVLGPATLATLEFVVRVKIQLKAMRLVVRNAIWTGVKAGEIVGTLTIALAVGKPTPTEIPVIRPRTFTVKADSELVLPAGGIKLV